MSVADLQGLVNNEEQQAVRSFPKVTEKPPWSSAGSDAKSFHAQTSATVAGLFDSSDSQGLSEALASSRLQFNGPNHILMPNAHFLRRRIAWDFFGGFAPILYLATILSFVAYSAVNISARKGYVLVVAVILVVIVLLNGAIQVWQELRAAHILRSTRQLMPLHSRVKRDGVVRTVKTTHLVVGDLIELRAGDQIPTDMRVVNGNDMIVDKSWLTGESRNFRVSADPQPEHISYLDAQCMLFVGSTVAYGSGWGMAVTVGEHNQVAKLLHMATRLPKLSSLRRDINMIAVLLSGIAIIVALAVVLYWAFHARIVYPDFITWDMLLIRLAGILISVLPLALPLVISVGLTIVATRLKVNWQVLTRKLDTIVTMGTISMLVTDKTGTLTQNKLKVTSMSAAVDNVPEESSCGEHRVFAVMSYRIAVLCNDARLDTVLSDAVLGEGDDDEEAGGTPEQMVETTARGSNATDRCILNWANESTDCAAISASYEVLYTEPFKSESRVAMVTVQHKQTQEIFVLLKGAPEDVLPRCSMHLSQAGESVEWTSGVWRYIVDVISTKASSGERVIVLAQMGPLPITQNVPQQIPDTGFTFVSCLALSDPIRPGTKETIERLRTAGIKVMMVTGDAVETAVSVAKQSGIVSNAEKRVHTLSDCHRSLGGPAPTVDDAIVLTGEQMNRLKDSECSFVRAHGEIIVARMSSEQRLDLVKNCKTAGHIVAVTGDGINDALSFQQAHVAVAMNNAPEVTRESGDVVLLTDDFSAMYEAVKHGRLVFANFRKALAFMLATALGLKTVVLLSQVFLGLPTPLNIFQVIVLCVVHNLIGGLALMYEPAEASLMRSPPRHSHRQRLLDWRLAVYSFLFYGLMLGIGAFYNYFDCMRSSGFYTSDVVYGWHWMKEISRRTPLGIAYENAYRGASSVFYVTLVVGQAFHLISVRRKTPYFRYSELPFPWIALGSVVLSVAVSTPFLYTHESHADLNTIAVSARYWVWLWVVSAVVCSGGGEKMGNLPLSAELAREDGLVVSGEGLSLYVCYSRLIVGWTLECVCLRPQGRGLYD